MRNAAHSHQTPLSRLVELRLRNGQGERASVPARLGWRSPTGAPARSFRRHVVASLWLIGACGRMPVEGETVTPGAPAVIIREMISGEGELHLRIVVDSAAASWRVTCTSPVIRCPPLWNAEGVTSRTQVTRLFATARSSEFQALRKEYDLSATYVDAPLFVLTMTVGGRTRSIRWSMSPVPAVLTRFDDQVLMTANLPTPDR
jgi:hypothetical protein